MAEEIRQTVRMSRAEQSGRDVYVRYTITRGEGPIDLFPAENLKTRYVIIVITSYSIHYTKLYEKTKLRSGCNDGIRCRMTACSRFLATCR